MAPKKKIKTSSAKAKGRAFQQWVCTELSDVTGIPYNQNDDTCDIHSREMGQHGSDIVLRGKARAMIPFSIECKRTETLSLGETIKQAEANRERDGQPHWLIVHRRNDSEPIAVVAWDTFRELLQYSIMAHDQKRH